MLGGLFALKVIPAVFDFAFEITIYRLQTWSYVVRCRAVLTCLGALGPPGGGARLMGPLSSLWPTWSGITESSTDPPAVPPANVVGDAFGKRRPLCRGSVTAGTTGCGWVG